jgi:hypothetical protein
VLIYSANFNSFDKQVEWENQDAKVIRLTDKDYPPRPEALTSRIYSKLIKCFGWQLFPNHDVYVWADASFKFLKGATQWLLDELGDTDIAVVKHPWNKTIKEEYQFLLDNDHKAYVHYRYGTELTEQQYAVIKNDPFYTDDSLFCGGLIIYRPVPLVQSMFKEWWYHISRYHLDDQLSLPYVIKNSGCDYKVIQADIYRLPLIPYMRKS